MTAGLILAAALGGPFPLLCTPYTEKGELDCEVLAKEARFVADGGANGVIWPAADEALKLLTPDEERRGWAAIVDALKDRGIWFCPCCPGTNVTDQLRRLADAARAAEAVPTLKLTALVRMTNDATTDEQYRTQYETVAKAVRHPVIIQTYNGKSPAPSARLLIDLATRHPDRFGWVKDEGSSYSINDHMAELAASDAIKTVFSGWGGRDWLYQYRRIGTRGVISQRPQYVSLMVKLWKALEANDPAAEELAMKWSYLRNADDFLPSKNMRGWNLYTLVKLGVFRNMLSREAKEDGNAKGWTLTETVLKPREIAEADQRLKSAGICLP